MTGGPLRARAVRGALALFIGVLLLGCETVRPASPAVTDVPSAGKFPHERLSMILEKVVSDDGLVDYAALQGEQELLEAYMAELARISPLSHPHLFPTEADQFAYWLNGHNAAVLKAVLYWNRPANLGTISGRFDKHTKFLMGGNEWSLAAIVNVIRKTFPDPRAHFVLVRGRRGDPPLSKEAYMPATLEAQLAKATRAFVNSEAGVQWEAPSRQVRLSRVILDNRADFERQASATVSGDVRLLSEVNRWRASGKKISANEVAEIPYDERLNDVGNR